MDVGVALIESAKEHRPEEDAPDPVLHFLEPDVLLGEDVAHVRPPVVAAHAPRSGSVSAPRSGPGTPDPGGVRDRRAELRRRVLGPATSVAEPGESLRLVAGEPLAAHAPTDPVARAALAHRVVAALDVLDEVPTL